MKKMTSALKTDAFGNPTIGVKQPEDFKHLIGKTFNNIVLFENSTEELKLQEETILPRYYHMFIGIKDGELKYKPYEFDKYRIVVSTYKDIIVEIVSVG